ATPGLPRFYATAVTLEGYAQPVLATTHAARPTKLDGNPQHPATRGVSDAFMQAAVLQLYDPARSQAPMRAGAGSTWAAFEGELAALRAEWTARHGEGLRILTGNVTSPTLQRQLGELLKNFPAARRHGFEPVGAGLRAQALRRAFGRDADVLY